MVLLTADCHNSQLDSVHDWRLVSLGPLNHLSGVGVSGHCGLAGALSVHIHQLVKVESWAPDHLNFANVHVMKRVDALACLLDISCDGVGDKFVDNILEVCGADFPLDDINKLIPDSITRDIEKACQGIYPLHDPSKTV